MPLGCTYTGFVCAVQDIIVYEEVVAEVGELVLHVPVETSDVGSKMNDMRRLVLVKDSLRLGHIPVSSEHCFSALPFPARQLLDRPEVAILARQEDPLLVVVPLAKSAADWLVLQNPLQSASNKA